MQEHDVVYEDAHYTLGEDNGTPYLIADGKRYRLTCHPYEPCLYITGEDGLRTAVHNAFDPSVVLRLVQDGRTFTSITGREYDAADFCRMVAYAAGAGNIGIDGAERVFGNRPKQKRPVPPPPADDAGPAPDRIIRDDPFFEVILDYDGCVIDYCLVKNDPACRERNAHANALREACRELFIDEGETIWPFDVGQADADRLDRDALFAPATLGGPMNYRKAFLYPPHGSGCTNADFDRVNAALFPKGTEGLVVYDWTTDWSEYFDDGHEWWGALCLTVYDPAMDRFAVILASATD